MLHDLGRMHILARRILSEEVDEAGARSVARDLGGHV